MVASNLWHYLAHSYITTISVSIVTWPSSLYISLCFHMAFLKRTLVIGFRAHPNPEWLHYNYTPKTLFPKIPHSEVTGDMDFEGRYSIQYIDHLIQPFHSYIFTEEKCKYSTYKICTWMFTTSLFVIAKTENNSDACQGMNG